MFKKNIETYVPICVFGTNYRPDPIAGQSFNRADSGWFKSDITLIVEAQSQSVADSIMSRLPVLRVSNPNLSDRELLDIMLPRYCQTYSERERFFKSLKDYHPEWFDEKGDMKDDVKLSVDAPDDDSNSSSE